MVDHVKAVLGDIRRVCPDYDAERGYELAGFVWFQGWNDMVDRGTYPDRDKPGGYYQYSECMVHFIRDVRKDLDAPGMPFVIGVMGVGGELEPGARMTAVHRNFRTAMAVPASLPEFEGNVTAVQTAPYWAEELEAIADKIGKVRNMARMLRTKNKNHANKDGTMSPEEQKAYVAEYRKEIVSAEDDAKYKRGRVERGLPLPRLRQDHGRHRPGVRRGDPRDGEVGRPRHAAAHRGRPDGTAGVAVAVRRGPGRHGPRPDCRLHAGPRHRVAGDRAADRRRRANGARGLPQRDAGHRQRPRGSRGAGPGANLYYDCLKAVIGCTAFAVATSTGTLHARNLDWWTEDRLLNAGTVVVEFRGAGGRDFLAIGWPGLSGVFSAVAPGRFAVTLNAVLSTEPAQLATPVVFLLREVLETAASYDEAADRLCRTPIPCDCLLLLSGPQPEQQQVIERTPARHATRQGDGVVWVTNDYHALDTGTATAHSELLATACGRFDRIGQLLQAKPPNTLDQCLDHLADHQVQMGITVQQMAFCVTTGEHRLRIP